MLLQTDESDLTAEAVDGMKVTALRAELTSRNLPSKGLKAELQKRLKEFIAAKQTEGMEVEATEATTDTTMEAEDNTEAQPEEEEMKPVAVEVTEEAETTEAAPATEENTGDTIMAEAPKVEKDEKDIDLASVFPVWVGDIPEKATQEEIVTFFEKDGFKVSSVKMTKGKGKHQGSQFAFVNFETQEGQKHAEGMNGVEFQGQPIQVSPRENLENLNKIFLGSLKGVEKQDELEEALRNLGDWNITRVQFKEGSNYGFVFFETSEEASAFYDDMKGKSIKDHAVNVEFPRTKEERAAIKQGASKLEIEKIKRTVYISDLHNEASEQQVREFCETNECGQVVKINKPKAKKKRAIMFVEFERKTDADRFVKRFGAKEEGVLNGEPFLAELSRAKPSRPKRYHNRGGRNFRGRGRGGWGGQQFQGYPGGYGGYGNNPYMNQYAAQFYGYNAGYGQYNQYGGYNFGGRGGGKAARGQRSYKPY